eukprot:c20065_g1_i1 orf=321-1781(+)
MENLIVSSNLSAPSLSVACSSYFGNRCDVSQLLSIPVQCTQRCNRKLVVQSRIREIFMPALSSTMTEGKIVSWVKLEGEKLSKGESVVVVESDKADMDVETFYDGYLAAIMVGEGGVASVGAPIALLAETEEEIVEAKSKADQVSNATAPAAPPPLADAPPTLPPPPTASPVPNPPIVVTSVSQEPKRVVATPHAKKLAKQYKVDMESLVGTGPYGRITASDVETASGRSPTVKPAPTVPSALTESIPTKSKNVLSSSAVAIVPGTTVPFTSMQAAVARNMVESLTVPTFRVGYAVVTDALDTLYKKIKPKGVTMTALLAKAVAVALAQHPLVNASCKDGKNFTYSDSINIAVAVAMDGGLITPVLQNADKMDIYSLSMKWKELVDKARMKQLQPQEYSTGTFTLSNLGMFGVDHFDAILPPGTGAIMAVGASQRKVVATADGLFGVKSQMRVNVTADHRIIYGADLAAFLQTFAKVLEEPDKLTL